jgi:hypothetical protein
VYALQVRLLFGTCDRLADLIPSTTAAFSHMAMHLVLHSSFYIPALKLQQCMDSCAYVASCPTALHPNICAGALECFLMQSHLAAYVQWLDIACAWIKQG